MLPGVLRLPVLRGYMMNVADPVPISAVRPTLPEFVQYGPCFVFVLDVCGFDLSLRQGRGSSVDCLIECGSNIGVGNRKETESLTVDVA